MALQYLGLTTFLAAMIGGAKVVGVEMMAVLQVCYFGLAGL